MIDGYIKPTCIFLEGLPVWAICLTTLLALGLVLGVIIAGKVIWNKNLKR